MQSIRYAIGFRLLSLALKVFPVSESVRVGVIRGMQEQRDYDRYEAYCQIEKAPAYSFDVWRELRSYIEVKTKSAEGANARLRMRGFRPGEAR